MKILLHIGQAKTGTSAIQAFLWSNRRALRRAGILYPSVRAGGVTYHLRNHNRVANALVETSSSYPQLTAKEYFDQFFSEGERTGADLMILSGENFFGINQWRFFDQSDENSYSIFYRKKLELLSDCLQDHRIDILVYLRPQVEWLTSMLAQFVRYRVGPVDLSDRQIFEFARPHLQYCRLLDLWTDVLEPASLRVVPYIVESLRSQSIISDFVSRVNLGGIGEKSQKMNFATNTSLSPEYTEVKRLWNQERADARNFEDRVVNRCLLRLSAVSQFKGLTTISCDVMDELECYVKDDNFRLATRYLSSQKFFSQNYSRRDIFDIDIKGREINHAKKLFLREYRRPRSQLWKIIYLFDTVINKLFSRFRGVFNSI